MFFNLLSGLFLNKSSFQLSWGSTLIFKKGKTMEIYSSSSTAQCDSKFPQFYRDYLIHHYFSSLYLFFIVTILPFNYILLHQSRPTSAWSTINKSPWHYPDQAPSKSHTCDTSVCGEVSTEVRDVAYKALQHTLHTLRSPFISFTTWYSADISHSIIREKLEKPEHTRMGLSNTPGIRQKETYPTQPIVVKILVICSRAALTTCVGIATTNPWKARKR